MNEGEVNESHQKPGMIEKISDMIQGYGQKMDKTLVTHFVVYCITLFMFPNNNIFMNMLTVDSTISAIQFIKTLYEGKDDILIRFNNNKSIEADLIMRNVKDFVNTRYPKYNEEFDFNNEGHINVIKKYIFYFFIQLISWGFNIIFWGYLSWFFNSILLLFAMPILYIAFISSMLFVKIFRLITYCFRSISVFVFSKMTAKIMNNLTETCLGQSPRIDHYEMIGFYENFGNSIDTTLIFLKTVFFQTIIHYLRKTDNIWYRTVIEIFRRYQIEALIPNAEADSLDNKAKILDDIVRARKWGEFLKPKTVNIIFDLYESKNNEVYSRRVGVFLRTLKTNLTRFVTLLSIATISPFCAIVIDASFAFVGGRFNLSQTRLAYAIGASVLFSGNVMVGSCLMILSELIIKPVIDYVDEKEIFRRFVIQTKDQACYLGMIPVLWLTPIIGFAVPPIVHYVNSKTMLNSLMFVSSIFVMLSGNNIFHITFMVLLSLICNNFLLEDRQPMAPINMGINVVTNYLEGSEFVFEDDSEEMHHAIDAKVAKVIEEPTYPAPTNANVCKWISSFVYK